MPAYVISTVKIEDESAVKNYRKLAEASIDEFGGKYLVRGADAEVVEGEQTDRKIVLVEFPSIEKAQQWYASSAYAKALQFRDKALTRQLIFVDGVAPFS